MSVFDIFPEVSLCIPLAVILGKGPLCTSLNVVSHLRDDSGQGLADPTGWRESVVQIAFLSTILNGTR